MLIANFGRFVFQTTIEFVTNFSLETRGCLELLGKSNAHMYLTIGLIFNVHHIALAAHLFWIYGMFLLKS
jgi:hypothetical protein